MGERVNMQNLAYNGWSTKATWLVNLWIDEYGLHGTIAENVAGFSDQWQFADWLKEFLEEAMGIESFEEEYPAGVIGDLFSWAWAMVDFGHLSQHFWDDYRVEAGKEEEDEDDAPEFIEH